MKLKTYAALAAMALCLTACDDGNSGGGGSSSRVNNSIGSLSSGTKADKDLPDGYKIKSVDGFTFSYDEDGMLTRISGHDSYEVIAKPFTLVPYDEDEGELKVSLNGSGNVSSVSASGEDEYEKWTGILNCSYNSFGQLSAISMTYKGTEYEDGERFSYTETGKYTFTYDKQHRITLLSFVGEDKSDHTDRYTEKYAYEYNDEYENPYYQYTPSLTSNFEDFDVFAYLGILGKASAYLPTGYQYEETYYCSEDKETEEEAFHHNCGSYSYNSYGALTSADRTSYTYTTISTRAAMCEYDWPVDFDGESKKMNPRSLFRHQRHQQK